MRISTTTPTSRTPPSQRFCAMARSRPSSARRGNNISGTNGNDVIHGLGGNDIINAGNGNDTICAGAGIDIL